VKVLDPGHKYGIHNLDDVHDPQVLTFVKRQGPNFPGNEGAYPGTTLQEVLRACCDRLRYVNAQGAQLKQSAMARSYSHEALVNLQQAILCLERRAASQHGRDPLSITREMAETGPTCIKCGHVGCKGECH
jgi:hypothetical protein